jgi:hypothetical protein
MVDKPPAINSSIELLTNLVGALTTQVAKLTTANELAHTQAAIQTTDTRQPKNFTNKKQRQWQPREDQQQQQQSQNPWQASPVQQQWTSQNPQQTSGWSQPLPVQQQQQQQYVAAPTNQQLPNSSYQQQWTPSTSSTANQRSGNCRFCDKFHVFDRAMCPAAHVLCDFCKKPGHFRSKCYRNPENQAQNNQQ